MHAVTEAEAHHAPGRSPPTVRSPATTVMSASWRWGQSGTVQPTPRCRADLSEFGCFIEEGGLQD